MRERWQHRLSRDPFYNVNLSLENGNFELGSPVRRVRPWKSAALLAATQRPACDRTEAGNEIEMVRPRAAMPIGLKTPAPGTPIHWRDEHAFDIEH
jgi:O-antigen biosynthesis protein